MRHHSLQSPCETITSQQCDAHTGTCMIEVYGCVGLCCRVTESINQSIFIVCTNHNPGHKFFVCLQKYFIHVNKLRRAASTGSLQFASVTDDYPSLHHSHNHHLADSCHLVLTFQSLAPWRMRTALSGGCRTCRVSLWQVAKLCYQQVSTSPDPPSPRPSAGGVLPFHHDAQTIFQETGDESGISHFLPQSAWRVLSREATLLS